MRHFKSVLAVLGFSTALFGQEAQPTPAPPLLQGGPAAEAKAPHAEPRVPLVVYQVDLVPTGHALAVGEPRLEGDGYVFYAWPDRRTVKLDKSKVKKIFPRTKDLNHEVVWQVDLLPSGRLLASQEPVLKGKTYTVKKWLGGTLMSLRQADVAKITRLTGLDAFKAQQQEKGAARIGDLSMEGGAAVTVLPGSEPPEAAPPAQEPPPGYGGYPAGISEAHPPPSAVQDSPGDVPKAAPTPQH